LELVSIFFYFDEKDAAEWGKVQVEMLQGKSLSGSSFVPFAAKCLRGLRIKSEWRKVED
jgi:hypothetical protein